MKQSIYDAGEERDSVQQVAWQLLILADVGEGKAKTPLAGTTLYDKKILPWKSERISVCLEHGPDLLQQGPCSGKTRPCSGKTQPCSKLNIIQMKYP